MTAALPRLFPTVVHMLADAAAVRPDAPALVFGDRQLDYRRYAISVAAFAAELEACGACGARVATLLPNSIEACIAGFAVPAAGAQHVPLNPLYTERELQQILEDASPAVLVIDERLLGAGEPAAAAAGVPRTLVVGPQSRRLDPHTQVEGSLSLPDPDALALLQYTGGTTGLPKGVNLRHRAIAVNVAQREGVLPTRVDAERILCVMPLFHSYAMAMGLFLAAHCRGCLVVLERYQPDVLLESIARERITIFPGSPTLFIGLMAHPEFARTDWSSVHTCYSGAAPLAAETLRRWRDAVGAPVYEGYGQTEAGPVLSFNPVDGLIKPGSVGLPVAETTLEVVDVESGTRVLPAGERGEIRARGPQLMQGYRNRKDETAQALRGGWLYTGDIGEFDRDGYLFIRDRKKDMVIVGGYNVYPREIEDVLSAHSAVAEAAAVGAPDSYRGEIVRAYVVLRSAATVSPAALLAHCAANLAKYKVPATLELVDALPKTSVSKTDKQALRARARVGS